MFSDIPHTDNHNTAAPAKENPPMFDPAKIKDKLCKYWWMFLLTIPLAGAAGFYYIKSSVPVERVSGTVLVDGISESSSPADMVFNQLEGKSRTGKTLEKVLFQMRSESLMFEVIKELGLNIRYFHEGKFRETEYYRNCPISIISHNPEVAAYASFRVTCKENRSPDIADLSGNKIFVNHNDEFEIGYDKFTVNVINPQFSGEILVRTSSYEAAVGGFIGKFQSSVDNAAAGILRLNFYDPIARRGVDVINTIVECYNVNDIKQKQQISNNTSHFINERLEKINNELDSTETTAVRFQQANQYITSQDGVSQVMQQKIQASENLQRLKNEKKILNNIESILRDKGDNKYRILPMSASGGIPTIETVVNQYNDLILRRNKMLGNANENSPAIVRLTSQIDNMKIGVADAVSEAIKILDADYQLAQRESNIAKAQVFQAPSQQKEFRSISRQQDVKEKLFLYLLQKREEAEISKQTFQPILKFISKARSYGGQSFNPLIVFGGVGFVGLGIPVGLIFLLAMFDTKIRGIEDVRRNTSATILGILPHLEKDNSEISNNEFYLHESRNMICDKISYLIRTETGEGRVIMVTSTMPGEGKSLVSSHLATAFTHLGKKVIVVGADLRNPSLHKFCGKENHQGLSAYLAGKEQNISTLIHKADISESENEKLSFNIIFAGAVPPNPTNLLSNNYFRDLIERFRAEYDYVIIDTPPVGIVSDGFTVAKCSDISIFVIRANVMDNNVYKLINELRKEDRLPNLGLILNDVRLGKNGNNYGYGYGYGYGAGRYYEKNNRKKKNKNKKQVTA